MAQNDGIALSGKPYNQTYFHIMTIVSGKITRLIESFDSALANDALRANETVPSTSKGPLAAVVSVLNNTTG